MKDAATTLATTNTKLAACLEALGFVDWTADAIQPARGGPMQVQFLFKSACSRPEYAGRVDLSDARRLLSGSLEKEQPMHPLCVMMRGQHNYNRLLNARATGAALRLASVAGGCMTFYVGGPLASQFLAPGVEVEPLEDFALVAALGGVGLPLVRITGSAPRQRFEVARFGFAIAGDASAPVDSLKQCRQEDARALVARSPVPEDPLRLALEVTNPFHPVVQIYDALAARARLQRQLERVTPLLLIEGDGLRQALVSMNATGRVMEKATAHLRAPPVRWKS